MCITMSVWFEINLVLLLLVSQLLYSKINACGSTQNSLAPASHQPLTEDIHGAKQVLLKTRLPAQYLLD